ncbi:MAG TPA: response regulator [Bryobacteraceae bacterium]|nr:response regulator [Bryobacteraceae bacterium]
MNLEGIRALLVEDNPGDARLFFELVRETGAGYLKLEHVDRLDKALARLSSEHFDVVLLDLSLPDEQGLTTLLRTHAHAPKVPIVILTGLDDEAMAVKAVRAGAQDYLVKGRVDGDLLVRSMRYATERWRAVEALERREEHYRSLIEHSLDLISILNVDGTIRYVSPSHERVLGYPSDDLVGQNVFGFIHADDLAGVKDSFTRQDGAASLECRFRHKDGSWRMLESFGRNLSHVPGVSGLVVNSRDVTDRKRLEEQLHHSQRLEAVGRLAGGVAHDFNNLLMVITGYSQMLLDGMAPADPARDDLEQVVKASERATDLTRQLLAFSRRQVVRPVILNLNLLVRDMDRMLRRVIGEDIELVASLAPDLKTVRADPGQIEQVVLNIAVNARDAMPNGGKLTLETANLQVTDEFARMRPAPKPGHYAMLLMGDTGFGMDAGVLLRLFEPFFTTKENGTGLGLSTSYGIIKQSGGDIWVDSKPGQGTTFRIYLPVAEEAAEPVEAHRDSAVPGGAETILLVEDEDGVRRVVETMLTRHGYNVLSSGSCGEAMALAERYAGPIHLLITDVVMPGMSGRTMAENLIAQRPETKVLYVSGYGGPVESETTTGFLQKPFTTEELARKIRELFPQIP